MIATIMFLLSPLSLESAGDMVEDIETRGPVTPHDLIRINSDSEFASMASVEGWVGDGSEGDPYIIEDLEINGTGKGFGLFVGNTTVHFIVRNCTLKNATYPPPPYYPGVNNLYYFEAALNLFKVENATVSGVIAEGSEYGMHIFMDNGWIENCTIRQNNVGIRINGNDDTIRNCDIVDNAYAGIIHQDGADFNVSDSRIKGNARGLSITGESSDILGNEFENQDKDIFFSHTKDCFLSGNELSKGFSFDYMEKEEFLSLTVLPDNTLGGKPIRFYRDEMPDEIDTTSNLIYFINIPNIELDGITIDSPASPLNFIYCNGMTIANSNFSSTSGSCLNISSTYNLTIKDSSFHDSPVGIAALGMDNVIVEGCRAWNCGIGMDVGMNGLYDRLIVNNCSAYDNEIAGIVISQRSHQATCVVEENEAWNNGIGMIYDSRKGGDFGEGGYGVDAIRNNTLRNNGAIGLLLELRHGGGYKTLVENNSVTENSVGINVTDNSGSSGVFLSSNIISGNDKDGLTGLWSNGGVFMGENWFKTGCMINDNTIEGNGWNGMNLSSLRNGGAIYILNNTIRSNGMSGISIGEAWDGGPNPITGNSITDNGGIGIELLDLKNGGGPYNVIEDNLISGNRGTGSLSHRYYPDLPVVGGISIISDLSSGYRIRNNTIINNLGIGIFKGEDRSGSGNVSGNMVKGNTGDGIIITASEARDRSIVNNTIMGNTGSGIVFGGGIDSYAANANTISGNAVGITLRHSNDTSFSKNIVTGNGIGFLSEWGDNATIRSNLFSDNEEYGVRIKNGNYSTIWENSFFRNNEANETYNSDHRQACDNGTGNLWYSGTIGNYWDDWRNSSVGDIRTDPYPLACGAGTYDPYPLIDPPFGPFEADLNIDYPADGAILNTSNVTIEFTVLSNGALIDAVEGSIDGGFWLIIEEEDRWTLTDLEEGSHVVNISVLESGGRIVERSINFTIDLTDPTISDHSPIGDDVSIDNNITVTFSEDMDPSRTLISFSLPGDMTKTDKTVTFDPTNDLSTDTTYRVDVDGHDLAGRQVTFNWSFTTRGADALEYRVTGRVVDEDGNPISGAKMYISGARSIELMTSVNGSFGASLEPGSYSYTLKRSDYEDRSMGFEVVDKDIDLGDIVMYREDKDHSDPPHLVIYLCSLIILILIIIAIGAILFMKRKKPHEE